MLQFQVTMKSEFPTIRGYLILGGPYNKDPTLQGNYDISVKPQNPKPQTPKPKTPKPPKPGNP